MKKNKFKPDKELLEFANYFSKNYKKLPIGEYHSDNGNGSYVIKYMNGIKDKDTGRVIRTVARVSAKTGVVEFDRKWILKKKKITGNYVFYLIIWHAVMKWLASNDSHSAMDADKITNELYVKTERPKKDIAVGWLELFSDANTPYNEERYKEINKQLLEAQSKSKKNKNEIKSRTIKANSRKGNRKRKK